jgi:ElaB/YqjD/DUF883 family membrane-anchored ribosome-binding protein
MENEAELIRQQMVETRTALSDKLEALEERVVGTIEGTAQSVTDTVNTVQEAVEQTVSTVSETVEGTVESVKETFDLSGQMEKHPWLMVGGAVALGYLGGRLLDSVPTSTAPVSYATQTNGHTSGRPLLPGWLQSVAGPALEQLQTLALGAVAGLATDLIDQHAPEALRGRLHEMASNITTSLGAEPIRGLWPEKTPEPPPSVRV